MSYRIHRGNLVYVNSDKKYSYSLYLNVINYDGNLYDCISKTLLNFFDDNSKNQNFLNKSIGVNFIKKYTTVTICYIDK